MISIIIPVFNEEKQIQKTLDTIRGIMANDSIPFEFILVDDGSKDHSWDVISNLSIAMPGIKGIRLSRNFGKEAALCAGLEASDSDACIIIDADLQHPPEMIPEMIRLWQEEGYEVVEGVKSTRGKESLLNKLGARSFYGILKRLSGFDLDSASDFKLMDRKVVTAWKTMAEHNTFFRGMSAWVGFNRTTLPFVVADRETGKSRWSILHLFKLAVNAITSFSSIPLQFVTFLGMAFLVGSCLLGIQTLYMYFKGIAVSGFTTVILLLLIIGSALMISMGIIGTYIARIFDEVKRRPRYLVSKRINQSELK